MRQRLLVAGNGMAGMHMVETLLQLAPMRYAITVIGDEPEHAYNRIQLSPVLGGENTVEQTLIHDPDWYHRHGITLRVGETVEQVNIAERTLRTDQRPLRWDRLVFATGSQPCRPSVPGSDPPHVFTFRTLQDVNTLLAGHGPVVVVGGGYLGIEAAAGLQRVQVTTGHADSSSVTCAGQTAGYQGRGITAGRGAGGARHSL